MKKFKKGAQISDLDTLATVLKELHWVFYKDKPLHPNFIRNMNFGTVLGGIKGGRFFHAESRKQNE